MNSYHKEKAESWISDFCGSVRYNELPFAVQEYSVQVLYSLLAGACERSQLAPEDLTELELRDSLLNDVAKLALPESIKQEVPNLCRDFLEGLEEQGRLSGGAEVGRYLAALHVAYKDAAADKVRPITNVASKLGRNDPCPCGSGKKYKKCCKQT